MIIIKNNVITRYRFTLNASLFFVSMAKIVLLFFSIFLFLDNSKVSDTSIASLAVCFLFFNVGLVVAPFFSYRLQKHLGTKWNLMRCIFLLAVGTLGLAFCKNLPATCIGAFIVALGTGYKKPAFLLCNISEKDFENEQTRKEMGEYSFAGVVLGVLIGIAGVMFLQYRGVLFVVSLMLLFCAVLNLVIIKDTTPKEDRMASYPIVSAIKVFSDGAFSFIKNQFLNLLIGFLNIMIVLLVPFKVALICDYVVLPWNVGISVAFLIMAHNFKSVFKTLTQKHNTKAVFFFTSLLLGGSFLLFNLAKNSMLVVLIACLLVSLFSNGQNITKRVLAVESLTPSAKDAEFAITSQIRSSGAILGCLLVYLLRTHDVSLFFMISLFTSIFAGIFVLLAYRTPKD